MDVHRAIQALFERQGYKTGVKDGRMQGFFHGTGHGLGLQIHEAPSIGKRPCVLRAGHVVTVEPGLYYLGLGGVRIEDVALVTKTGSRCLTRVAEAARDLRAARGRRQSDPLLALAALRGSSPRSPIAGARAIGLQRLAARAAGTRRSSSRSGCSFCGARLLAGARLAACRWLFPLPSVLRAPARSCRRGLAGERAAGPSLRGRAARRSPCSWPSSRPRSTASNRVDPDGSFLLDVGEHVDTARPRRASRWELVAGYPPQVPGLAGVPMRYHVGSHLVRAAAARWAGIHPYDALSRFDVTLWAHRARPRAARRRRTRSGSGRGAVRARRLPPARRRPLVRPRPRCSAPSTGP